MKLKELHEAATSMPRANPDVESVTVEYNVAEYALASHLFNHAAAIIELQEAALAVANHWTMENNQRLIDALAKLEE